MEILIKDLKPNPFRDLTRYPPQADKVEALKRSIKDTQFWDNVIARRAPNGSGGYELAYGHNRLEALRQLKVEKVDIPVRDLDDTTMARIMSQENMAEWGHSATSEQETVRAIIRGYADGRINLPKPTSKASRLRFAPHFSIAEGSDSCGSHPYTADTLGEFLRWLPYKVDATLGALALIEEGLASDEQFVGLRTKQAEVVVTETRHALRETKDPAKARAVGEQLAAGISRASEGVDRSGQKRNKVQNVTIHNAREKTNALIGKHAATKRKAPPNIDAFTERLCLAVADAFPGPRLEAKIKSVIQFRNEGDLKPATRRRLVGALRGLAKRASDYADRLEA